MAKQQWIKAALKAQGHKLKDAAEALGIPAPRMTDIIKGNREVQSDEVIKLAKLLGISATSLLISLDKGEMIEAKEDRGEQIKIDGILMGDGTIKPLPYWPNRKT